MGPTIFTAAVTMMMMVMMMVMMMMMMAGKGGKRRKKELKEVLEKERGRLKSVTPSYVFCLIPES